MGLLRWIGACLFGYERELGELRDRVLDLSWDRDYGVLTRPGLEAIAHQPPDAERTLAFLSFDDARGSRTPGALREINNRIRRVLQVPLYAGLLVGRWFANDGVLVVADDVHACASALREMRKVAEDEQVSFRPVVGSWARGREPLDHAVDRLMVLEDAPAAVPAAVAAVECAA